jgi:hypothetical protein
MPIKTFISTFLASTFSMMIAHAQQNLKYIVKEAPEWSDLFKRHQGWFGADGIYSVSLNHPENKSPKRRTKHLFWFSDTVIGEVKNNKPVKGAMVNNSLGLLSGSKPDSTKFKFYWNESQGKPQTIFIPDTTEAVPGDYYWLGDGFYNRKKKKMYIIAYRMYNSKPGESWSFRQRSIDMIEFPVRKNQPVYGDYKAIPIPYAFHKSGSESEIGLGAGIVNNTKEAGSTNPDGYIYIYGVRGKNKELIAARVREDSFETYAEWRFWNGVEWTRNTDSLVRIAANISNEMSVSQSGDGQYLLVYQQSGLSDKVMMSVGKSPVGPFGKPVMLYRTTESTQNKNYFAYNAKAHPGLSNWGELLISYNVNSFEFISDITKNAAFYRPRFIKIIFEK